MAMWNLLLSSYTRVGLSLIITVVIKSIAFRVVLVILFGIGVFLLLDNLDNKYSLTEKLIKEIDKIFTAEIQGLNECR